MELLCQLNFCEGNFWLFMIWQNWVCRLQNFTNSAAIFFFGMADKRWKILNSFRNTSYKSKFSKVLNSIERLVRDAVKLEKQNNKKVFYYDDPAQIKQEICCVSDGKSLTLKRACSSSKLKKRIHLLWQLLAKVFVQKWDIILKIYKQLPEFPVMSNSTLCK